VSAISPVTRGHVKDVSGNVIARLLLVAGTLMTASMALGTTLEEVQRKVVIVIDSSLGPSGTGLWIRGGGSGSIEVTRYASTLNWSLPR